LGGWKHFVIEQAPSFQPVELRGRSRPRYWVHQQPVPCESGQQDFITFQTQGTADAGRGDHVAPATGCHEQRQTHAVSVDEYMTDWRVV